MNTSNLQRRTFLGVVAGLAGSAYLPAWSQNAANAAGSAPWSAGTQRPKIAIPANSVDCHHHIYYSKFPKSPTAGSYREGASVEAYRLLQKRTGLQKNVIVQPSYYGTDNSGLVYALGAFGRDARGIAVVDANITLHELQALDAAGVRGIRFSFQPETVPTMAAMAKLIAPLGWHLQINPQPKNLVDFESALNTLPCPVVFDHFAKLPVREGTGHPAFAVVDKLLQRGKAWLKLSAAYLVSVDGPPRYADMLAVGQAFVRSAPERLVWGSDWPHPSAAYIPDDAALLDLLQDWAPDARTRHRILAENPARLYGFET